MSSMDCHVPTARPARKAAPSVVASSTGDTSTGRWVAFGQRLHEGRVGGHPAVDAQVVDGEAGVGLGRLDQVGAAVGDALEHGPHDCARVDAAGEAEQRAAAP